MGADGQVYGDALQLAQSAVLADKTEGVYSDPAKVQPILQRCGFSQVLIAPFWGHGYFRHFPGLREVETGLQWLAERNDWRMLSSYAYTIARR